MAAADEVEFGRPDLMDPESDEFKALMDPKDADTPEGQGDTKEGAAPGAEGEGGEKAGEEEPVVLAADGKHVIPFEVFKGLRDSEAEARRQAQEASDRARELEERLKAMEATARAGKEEPTRSDQLDELSTDIETLKEEFPMLGAIAERLTKAVDDVRQQVQHANARVKDHDQLREEEQKRMQEEVNRQVREAIDANPVLSHWASSDPDAWQRAIEMDKTLKGLPEWRDKPYSERFEAVVTAVRAIYPKATTPTKVESREEIERKAKEVLDKAGKEGADIESLSDIPGGRIPASRVDPSKASPIQLMNMMEGWSDDQISDWLAKQA